MLFLSTRHVCLGSDTWAKNWAALLGTKTQEGAYSWLKTFVKDHGDFEVVDDVDGDAKADKPSRESDPQESQGIGGDEPQESACAQQIVSRMTLKDLSFSGLKHVMESEEYKVLFDGMSDGDDKPALTSMDLKLLELRLELFIWDRREGFAT